MHRLFKKMAICLIIVVLGPLFLTACSGQTKPGEQGNNSYMTSPPNSQQQLQQTSGLEPETDPGVNPKTDSNPATPPNNPSSQTTENERALLQQIKQSAKFGKIINCEFAAKTTIFDEVEKLWGKPKSMDWVAAARGYYATYPGRDIVFGFNKGSQIFEVRSFAQQIQKLSLSEVQEFFGVPPYNVKVNGELIIGYKINEEFKLEFVFPEPTNKNPDPLLDHYLVLYPRGTVNYMSSEPGREW